MHESIGLGGSPRSWISLLLHPTESGFGQMVKFGMVGAMATLADCLTFRALLNGYHLPDPPYQVYQAVSYSVGTVVSYLLSVRCVFTHRNIANRRLEFAVYFAIALLGWALTAGIMHLGKESLHATAVFQSLQVNHSLYGMLDARDPERLAIWFVKAVAIVLVFFYNFGVRKAVMFARPKNR